MSARVLKIALAAILAPEALTQSAAVGLPAQVAGSQGVVPIAGAAAPATPIVAPATPIAAATPYQVPTAMQPAAGGAITGSSVVDTVFGSGDGKDKGMLAPFLKAAASTQSDMHISDSADKYSAESSEIVSGFVGGFMKGAPVDYAEKDCIQNNMADVTEGLVNVGYTIRDVAKNLMGMEEKGPNGIHHQHMDKGGLMSDGINGALSVTTMVSSINSLAKTCFKDDSIQLMKEAGEHMGDIRWLKQSFANQGVNIVRACAESIIRYGRHDYHGFGHQIGKAFRKVLLNDGAVKGDLALPPGVDPQVVTEKVTEGAMNGFFVQGTTLDITDKLDDKVHVTIDLNKCLYGNRDEWEKLFEGTWGVMANFASGAQHKIAPNAVVKPIPGAQNDWQNDLMLGVVELPLAAGRCGFRPDVYDDVKRASKNLGGLHFKFRFPNGNMGGVKEINNRLARAIEDWTNQQYRHFGDHLGTFMRHVVFLAGENIFATGLGGQKYDGTIIFEPKEWADANQAQQVLSVSGMYGGIAMVFLLVLVAVRIVRPSLARAGSFDEENQLDDELHEDAEGSAVE